MLSVSFLTPSHAHSVEATDEPPLYTVATAREYIAAFASSHSIPPGEMVDLVSCETAGTFDPGIQSAHPNKADGGRELSFGLAQIHLPDHKDITQQQATDPYFALEWMAAHWADRWGLWTCYRLHHGGHA